MAGVARARADQDEIKLGARADLDEMKSSSLLDMSQLTVKKSRKRRNYIKARY